MSVQNKMAPRFSIFFTRFDINFLENAMLQMNPPFISSTYLHFQIPIPPACKAHLNISI